MRVLSGIQPSGKLHIGNFFGAMRQHLHLQAENEAFYFIADYHALTSSPSAEDLKQYTIDVALDYLALGLDPAKTVFWKQSDVPEVTELADSDELRDHSAWSCGARGRDCRGCGGSRWRVDGRDARGANCSRMRVHLCTRLIFSSFTRQLFFLALRMPPT